ncbi:MAG: pyridoxal-phosphate dependent enzyme [Myxococcales bacterium]|nr:pyridoxal-phosphate dependent enzyme [Myxococcales bacterium]
MHDALAAILPAVDRALPRVRLGDWPTPIEPLALRDALWVKREDLSSPLYGGNKVRCLEPVIAALEAQGARRIWATGAWGSNQAVAIAAHGARRGLATGALLFPQPAGAAAADNLRALMATDCAVRLLPSIALFPWGVAGLRLRGEAVIPPGAAVPRGALGHLTAALEVAESVAAGALPAPRHVVLAVGSTCTTAGLLVGFAAAARLGVGFTAPPVVHAVRVTPWPVTARRRIVGLALATARLLAQLGGPDVADRRALAAGLTVSGAELGRGYGHPTASGRAAIAAFAAAGGPRLDPTYAGKSGAWLRAHLDRLDGPTLFWATKSAALPPRADDAALAGRVSPRVMRWLDAGRA